MHGTGELPEIQGQDIRSSSGFITGCPLIPALGITGL